MRIRRSLARAVSISLLLAFVALVPAAPLFAADDRSSDAEATDADATGAETGTAGGDTDPVDGDATWSPRATAASDARLASLVDVLAARRQLEADLQELQDELRSDRARGREGELESQIQVLSAQLAELDRNFSELASGFDPSVVSLDQQAEALDLGSELRDLLAPLVNELKRATSRPREIDQLRTQITQIEDRLGKISSARERVAKLRERIDAPDVAAALAREEDDWSRRAQALRTDLKVAQQKLAQRLGESRSISETIENVFQLFFKSRGRNLLVALLLTLAFLYALRRLRVFVAERPTFNRHSASFQGRIFSLVYTAFSVLGGVLVFLLALYLFGDWVLLILMLLLLLGIIWTSKQAIPRFWGQTVLLLDMGPVREGERLVHAGLPWRVDSISFYTELSNPELAGGTIRLPIDDLREMRSRTYLDEEPWFPTRRGDVILLDGERPATVELQSLETVRLRAVGGNCLNVSTADFYAQTIERLSDGYRVNITFGLDYADQAEITTTMVDVLGSAVDTRWRASRWAESLVSSCVEFENAGASSLDLFVRVDLDGRSAMDLAAQKRFLATVCVDVCNEQGWTIPFTQLTLHVAGHESADGSAGSEAAPP